MSFNVRDFELAKYNTLQLLEKPRKPIHKPCCFNFFSESRCVISFFTCLISALLNDRKQPSANVKKNICSVKMQDGPFDHTLENYL